MCIILLNIVCERFNAMMILKCSKSIRPVDLCTNKTTKGNRQHTVAHMWKRSKILYKASAP
jgi:hypothetical protein